jgi:hypothetical protein
VTHPHTKALAEAIEALESIALAGMSGTGQESEEAMTARHARRAWEFIRTAARALEPARAALASPQEQAPGAEPVATEQIEKAVEAMLKAAWAWGESCGVDGVGFNEKGDSHNDWMRHRAMQAKDAVYALFATPSSPGAAEAGEADALGYATRLAEAIRAKHYAEVTQWRALPDLLGVLTQIDNMTSGLTLAKAEAEARPVTTYSCTLGLTGKAFDPPTVHRAYTYAHQPNNEGAYGLGSAAKNARPGGDFIDHGLSLLRQLEERGFGVFELPARQALSAAPREVAGWKLVPVEPTDAMDAAGLHASHNAFLGAPTANHRKIYRAMLAAAPQEGTSPITKGDKP